MKSHPRSLVRTTGATQESTSGCKLNQPRLKTFDKSNKQALKLSWNTLNKLTNNDLGIPIENKTKADTTAVQNYIDNGYHLISKPRPTLSPPSVPVPVTEI